MDSSKNCCPFVTKLCAVTKLGDLTVMNEGQGLFTLASTNRGARLRRAAGERCLVKQFARTDTRKNSFAVRAVDSWNKLPDSVRAEDKLPLFKRKLIGLAA